MSMSFGQCLDGVEPDVDCSLKFQVVELLSHSIRCEMPFAKFIPAYHHHFGRQCRVADYGYSKLAELFEAISDTIVTLNPGSNPDCSPEDKIIRLSPHEQTKVNKYNLHTILCMKDKQQICTYQVHASSFNSS